MAKKDPAKADEIDLLPVYNLTTYDVGEEKVSRNNGKYSTQIIAILDFPPDNPPPSGKE